MPFDYPQAGRSVNGSAASNATSTGVWKLLPDERMHTRLIVAAAGLLAASFGLRPMAADAAPVESSPLSVRNGLYAQLGTQALTQAGLESVEGYVDSLFDNPGAAYGFGYIVGCALPFQTKLTLTRGDRTVEFEGSLGLAPEWADGPCEEACQEWISACMLARTNAFGLPVDIYTDGPHPHLQAITRADRDGASIREGAFFGNLFQSPQRQYACRGDGDDPLALTWRVCTLPGNRCGIQALGTCGDVDGETGGPSAEALCDVDEKGLYVNCRAGTAPGAKVYTRVITNFLHPTSFAGTAALACEPPPPASAPAETRNGAGAACLTDAGCVDGLTCDTTWVGQGLCTRSCDDAAEQNGDAPCSDGETCLDMSGDPRCTRACTSGTCAAGQACTSLWLMRARPDDPGCIPFCHTDADCGTGTRCDARFGTCGMGPAPDTALADGEPCLTAPDPAEGEPVYCRGACFQVDEDPTRGLCASLVDLGTYPDCFDEPDTMTPYRPTETDDIALCIYRKCRTSDDCTAPLRCVRSSLTISYCLY